MGNRQEGFAHTRERWSARFITLHTINHLSTQSRGFVCGVCDHPRVSMGSTRTSAEQGAVVDCQSIANRMFTGHELEVRKE